MYVWEYPKINQSLQFFIEFGLEMYRFLRYMKNGGVAGSLNTLLEYYTGKTYFELPNN